MDRDALLFGLIVGATIYVSITVSSVNKKTRQALSLLLEQSQRMASELEDIHECLDALVRVAREKTKVVESVRNLKLNHYPRFRDNGEIIWRSALGIPKILRMAG